MNVNPDHFTEILIKVLTMKHPFLIHAALYIIYLVAYFFHHIIKHVLGTEVYDEVWKKGLFGTYNISVA